MKKLVIEADAIWNLIDKINTEIDQFAESSIADTSEVYKLLLMTRRELLNRFADFVYDRQCDVLLFLNKTQEDDELSQVP